MFLQHNATMAGFIQKGVKNILKKHPDDIVFLSVLRTPVTRAKKGGLKDTYDHELLAVVSRPAVPAIPAISISLTTTPKLIGTYFLSI